MDYRFPSGQNLSDVSSWPAEESLPEEFRVTEPAHRNHSGGLQPRGPANAASDGFPTVQQVPFEFRWVESNDRGDSRHPGEPELPPRRPLSSLPVRPSQARDNSSAYRERDDLPFQSPTVGASSSLPLFLQPGMSQHSVPPGYYQEVLPENRFGNNSPPPYTFEPGMRSRPLPIDYPRGFLGAPPQGHLSQPTFFGHFPDFSRPEMIPPPFFAGLSPYPQPRFEGESPNAREPYNDNTSNEDIDLEAALKLSVIEKEMEELDDAAAEDKLSDAEYKNKADELGRKRDEVERELAAARGAAYGR